MSFMAFILAYFGTFLSFPIYLYLIIRKLTRNTNRWLVFLISFASGPFILPLIYYYYQLLFPGIYLKTIINDFPLYHLLLILPSILIIYRKLKSSILLHFSFRFKLNLTEILLILLASFSFISIVIQLLFFPSTSVDELQYAVEIKLNAVEQTISPLYIGNFSSLGNINFKYNTAIRPGLIVLGSYLSLFSPQILEIYIVQFITLYYLILLIIFISLCVYRLSNNRESALVSIVIMLYSWIFVKNVLYGGKEILIFLFGLLTITGLYNIRNKLPYFWSPVIGMLIGVNILINFHGFLISCLAILSLGLINYRKIWRFSVFTLVTIIFAFVFSGQEIPFNLSFFLGHSVIAPFTNSITNKEQLSSFSDNIYKEYAQYESKTLTDDKSIISPQTDNTNKFSSVVINKYIKGKLQGLTQIGYYGIIFWIAGIMLLSNFNNLRKKPFMKYGMLFILLYISALFDPLNLQLHRYSFVAETSTKYTTFILIFAVILI